MKYLADVFLSIPEYHDEGRLPIGGGFLGPMAYIYASPMMATFTRRAQIFEHQQANVAAPGPLAAIVVVERDDQASTAPIPTPYSNALLDYGVNCLWLKVASDAQNAAFTVYVSRPTATPPATPVCSAADQLVKKTDGTDLFLEVHEEHDNRFNDTDSYPSAARFDVDNAGRITFGFKCLRSYCEAMERKVTWRESKVTPNPRSNTDPKQKTIKGWHDEQELSEQTSSGVWRSTGVVASIVPDERIVERDSVDFHDTWIPTSVIELDVAPTGKYAAWGLKRGSNYLHLQFDVAQDRWRVGLFASRVQRPGTTAPLREWSFRERMIHRDAAVPPTARFRFTQRDDGVWFPCGNACCKADGES